MDFVAKETGKPNVLLTAVKRTKHWRKHKGYGMHACMYAVISVH